MLNFKVISILLSCLLLSGCMVSEDKKAVIDQFTKTDSKIKRSDIKFGKLTPVDENNACYSVDIGKKDPVQVPIHKDKNKWVAANYMEGTSEQCVKLVKHVVMQSKEEPDAKKAVLRRLKDPDSAKFGSFTLIDDTRACLTVNARNSYGGYTGDQEAWLTKLGGEWQVLDIKEAKYTSCVDFMTKHAANALKRQGAGHTGKVINIHRAGDYTYYEVESNGEKLLIYEFMEPVRCKVGDTIEVPDSLPSKHYDDSKAFKALQKMYPESISAMGKLKVVR